MAPGLRGLALFGRAGQRSFTRALSPQHPEVQASRQAEFAKRMFLYNYRLYDRYHRPVASMAVLADESESWHPTAFGFQVLGCEHTLKFPTAKLLDFAGRENELQVEANPLALVTLAQLLT